ncbi:MAG: hypothetical protein KKB50_22420, partial [Planctomycetes bacterium]|nr:hypothetical protein [Planctomycetota bacterium]
MPSEKSDKKPEVLCGNDLLRLVKEEKGIIIQAKGAKWRDVALLGGPDGSGEVTLNACPVPLKIKTGETSGGIELHGMARDLSVSQAITFGESGWLEVETAVSARKKTFLKSLFSNFTFAPDGKAYDEYRPLKYQWIPNIRKRKHHVLADQVFRSPAVILCTDVISAALVPDLDFLKLHRPMETCLDLRLADGDGGKYPLFGFGFGKYRVDGHLYFAARPDAGIPLRAGEEARLK